MNSTLHHDAPRRSWLGRSLLITAVLGFGFWIWSGMFVHVRDVEATVAYPVFEVGAEPLALIASPDETIRGRIAKGQSVYVLLSRHGLSRKDVTEVVRAAKPFKDLSRVQVGQAYRVRLDEQGHFKQFELDISRDTTLAVSVTPFGYVADTKSISYDTRLARFSGTARTSLFAGLMNERGGAELIRLMQDIFAWRVDFARDIRKGDTFRMLVEEIWRDGEFDHYGAVRYAQINTNGRVVEGIYFGGEYYDPEGQALRATLLPVPVDYKYISSRFSHARRHPVYGTVRPHYGVDYVAARGTPVRAAGSGVVTFAGWKGDNGRLVMVRHNGVYRTAYAHLQKYGKGIKRGTRVKQGQIIGYVGSSGASTGTHLHYGVYKNGRVVDPLSLDYTPIAEAIDLAGSPEFQLAWDKAQLTLSRMEEQAGSTAPTVLARR